VALASGDPDALGRFIDDLPDLDPSDDFVENVVGCLQYAFIFVRGARGKTWQDHADPWLAEIRDWIHSTPIAARAKQILDHPVGFAVDSSRHLGAATDFIDRHPTATVVVYGLGTNGLITLEHVRRDLRVDEDRLRVADDGMADDQLAAVGLARVDPRQWDTWPDRTIVLVTPDHHEPIRRHLRQAGGREGHQFLIVPTAHRTAPSPAAAPPSFDSPLPTAP
jgi:hypothetical protein